MAGMIWEELSAAERLIAEQAVMNLWSLSKACRAAKDGTVLAVAETLAIEQGRELTRRALAASMEQERAEIEKKVP